MTRTITLSLFGDFLKRHAVSKQECAASLGITTSYVSMLARGAATPGLKLAGKIAEWSAKVDGEGIATSTWLKSAA